MPPNAMDIMQGLTALIQGLQENIQRGRGEELKALQVMAGLPGMQLAPAQNAEPTNIFQRLLGMPSYRPGPGGMPVAPIGPAAFTVTKTPSAQEFLAELMGGTNETPPASPSAIAPNAQGMSATPAPITTRMRGGAGGSMAQSRFGLTPEEIENDPEFLALLRTPGATYQQAAQRAAAIRKERVAHAKAQREAQAAGMESQLKARELIGRHYTRVRDQASLDAVNAQLAASGVIPPEALAVLPTVYAPADIRSIVESALPVQTQTEVSREVAKRRALDPFDIAKAGATQQTTGDIRQQQEYAQRLRTDPLDVSKAVAIEQGTAPYKIAAQEATGARAAQKAYDTAMAQAQATREGEPLTGEAATKVSTLNSIIRFANELQKLERPGFTGHIAGREGAMRQFTGNIQSDEVEFRRLLADAKDLLARARTGAAAPPAELDRLDKLLPAVTDPRNVFLSKLIGFGKATEQLRDDVVLTATTSRGAYLQQAPRMNTGAKSLSRQQVLEAMQTENTRRQAAGQPALTEQEALDAAKAKGYEVMP